SRRRRKSDARSISARTISWRRSMRLTTTARAWRATSTLPSHGGARSKPPTGTSRGGLMARSGRSVPCWTPIAAERHSPQSNSDLSRVTVTINGRKFRMACEDGQEAHLRRLASDFDQRIRRVAGAFGEIGNPRRTVMAALTIPEELVQVSGRLRALERELAALQDARAAAADHARATPAAGA